jgi:hypothetical protein
MLLYMVECISLVKKFCLHKVYMNMLFLMRFVYRWTMVVYSG